MFIQKKIAPYIVSSEESIFHALNKISANQKRIVFIVNDQGVLEGSLSDGDFRRWITSSNNFNLHDKVSSIMNMQVVSRSVSANSIDIEAAFSNAIDIVPLLNSSKKPVAVALNKTEGISIGEIEISRTSPAFVIAEIGNNHNGDFELAKKLVDLAVDSGADCVKFQMRDLNSLYKSGEKLDNSADLGAQYTHDLLSKFQLSNSELFEIFDYCKQRGTLPLCTPWDLTSFKLLESYGMDFYKIASADFTNHQLIESVIASGKPILCSTGMSTESEILRTVDFLKSKGAQFVLLHCNSTYPTPFKDINLSYIQRLRSISNGLVGYSGHERGYTVPVAAVALGAKIIEKHFTIDRTMEGNDHKVSLLPDEFGKMVNEIRQIEVALGSESERKLSQGELINRESLAKSLVINRKLKKGQKISRDMIDIKSPGQGLQPIYIEELIGKTAGHDFKAGDFFYESDLTDRVPKARNYKFSRPFGLPVRYHDYKKLVTKTNLDFVEFHFSYQDLEVDISDYLSPNQEIGFIVHSPELFREDHILDLASSSKEYSEKSVAELGRVCEITRELKSYFPKTKSPKVVVNAGGFHSSGFLSADERMKMYATVAESLANVDDAGLEIIIQTMPPFPWHFGGQSFHNLFVSPQEIAEFCKKYDYRICYDVSHSMMSCNYYKWSLEEFTQEIGDFVAHLHIVDALGVDGEGIQIGKGDVDFQSLAKQLREIAHDVPFIPEIWQGHKNGGEGFWYALEFLESCEI